MERRIEMPKKIITLFICFIFLTGMAPENTLVKDIGDISTENILTAAEPFAREGETTAERLNVRTGPGIMYPIVNNLKMNTKLRILGSIKGWLVVQMPDDSVGMVSEEYVKVTEQAKPEVYEGSDLEEGPAVYEQPVRDIPDDERLFSLVNEYRVNFGLTPYGTDERVTEAARIKAADMVENNYFNHESPVYGTPFAMLRNMGVFYKTASENLAHTDTVTEAFQKMTGNLAHRTNLVSKRYTDMGVGVVDDVNEPGKKIIVLLFTED